MKFIILNDHDRIILTSQRVLGGTERIPMVRLIRRERREEKNNGIELNGRTLDGSL